MSYRYWLIEAPQSYPGETQDMELPTRRLAEEALADRVADLVADDFVVVRQGAEHATLTHPEEGKVEVFIEEGRAVPLRTIDVTGCTREEFERILDDPDAFR